jgi:dUTP pyrophosphatase
MVVKIKRMHKDAVLPKYAHPGEDAGMDLVAVTKEIVDSEHVRYGLGIAVSIPKGFVGYIFPRSSCYKQRQLLSNCVGVIDSGYTGELSAVMIGSSEQSYNVGDRVAQLIVMPYPEVEFVEVDEFEKTSRGAGSYGSTGKN